MTALIDLLEKRSDSVKLVEGAKEIQATWQGVWYIMLDGAGYPVTEDAFDTLLNLLRIPIKYVKRCVEEDGGFLAEASVNYWLEKCEDLSFLVENLDGFSEPAITQVFPGKCLYLPAVNVNDLVIDYLEGDVTVQSFTLDDDVLNAVYLTSNVVKIGRESYSVGVRVLFSDCFSITPRFDGVLYNAKNGTLLGWPTLGRKFRVASNTVPQVVDQIEEFLDLSIDGLHSTLVPALRESLNDDRSVLADEFLTRLCNDLRYSRKVKDELMMSCVLTQRETALVLIKKIAAYTAALGEESSINIQMARDIQVALSNYIVTGSLK